MRGKLGSKYHYKWVIVVCYADDGQTLAARMVDLRSSGDLDQ